MTTDDARTLMMSNQKFCSILELVNKKNSVEQRVQYVLNQMNITNDRYVHIVGAGIKVKNLSMYSLWQATGFKPDYHECNLELATLVSDYFKNEIGEELISILQFIKVLQENILQDQELQNIISIYNDLF